VRDLHRGHGFGEHVAVRGVGEAHGTGEKSCRARVDTAELNRRTFVGLWGQGVVVGGVVVVWWSLTLGA
jgi:hypothetical protein